MSTGSESKTMLAHLVLPFALVTVEPAVPLDVRDD
jgi:hypothetical protein